MDVAALYPASPRAVKRAPSSTRSYKLRVALVIVALTLFFAFYFGLLGGSLWLLYLLYAGGGPEHFVLLLLCGVALCMLVAFLVKGLFHVTGAKQDHLIELKQSEQPELFSFVRRLCEEAGCAFPKHIYLSHDVNAAVLSKTSLLSLFVPSRKSLLIGGGLVNALNISELKAVLAHEFGHFSQSSTRLGQHVCIANRVVFDMVVMRDSWDRALMLWRSIDIRLSFPAWILTAIVWVLRKLLEQAAKLLNLASRSLSREMEFDADAVAVRLAGSDAIVSGLWKTERAGIAMMSAQRMLSSMADHGKFSTDLFHHQEKAQRRFLRWLEKNTQSSPFFRSLRTPYQMGEAIHFQEGDDHAPSMWSTHPSNRDREICAKKRYVAAEVVQTPAWALFRNSEELRRKLTLLSYEELLGQRPQEDRLLHAAELEALGKEERQEMRQAAHYHGFYQDRVVEPGDIEALARELDGKGESELSALRAEVLPWTGSALAEFFAQSEKEYQEFCRVRDRAAGKPQEKSSVKDPLSESEAKTLLPECEARLKKTRDKLAAADKLIFRYFYVKSGKDAVLRDELLVRYRFQAAVQTLIVNLNKQERVLATLIDWLAENRQPNQTEFRQVQVGFSGVDSALHTAWKQAAAVKTPRLSHIAENTSVQDFLGSEPPSFAFVGDKIDGTQIQGLLRAFALVLVRLRKLHFKNLGALLKLQESLDPALYPEKSDANEDEDDVAAPPAVA